MILSVSRRTDIPAFYSDWFFKQLDQGFVLVPNPIAHEKIAKIALEPLKIENVETNLLGEKKVETSTEDETIEALREELAEVRTEIQRLNARTDEILAKIQEKMVEKDKGGVLK